MNPKRPLDAFFAVTLTSIYHVQALGPLMARAIKIRIRSGVTSGVQVGEDLCRSGTLMLSLGSRLHGFEPYHRIGGEIERRLDRTPLTNIGPPSSYVVGLFLERHEADACFDTGQAKPLDPRWMRSTRRVTAMIGMNHPSVAIQRSHQYGIFLEQGHYEAARRVERPQNWVQRADDAADLPPVTEGNWVPAEGFLCAVCGGQALISPYANRIWGCRNCIFSTEVIDLFFQPVT